MGEQSFLARRLFCMSQSWLIIFRVCPMGRDGDALVQGCIRPGSVHCCPAPLFVAPRELAKRMGGGWTDFFSEEGREVGRMRLTCECRPSVRR